MKRSQRNYSLLGNLKICKSKAIIFICISFCLSGKSQVANYIANGSFEEHYTCAPFYPLSLAKYWLSIDSISGSGGYRSKCDNSVPLTANGYQYPKSGEAYIIAGFYCLLQGCGRGYLKNRLKQNLQAGKTYCVKFHVSIANSSPRGMDGFGAYFGNNTIDTITKCNIPLSYLTPQVKNPIGNVISDTLNWVPITGTFVSNGTEKYAIIGNFLPDNMVTTGPIYTPSYPQYWTDVFIDDVSCIDIDLPAYAGKDTSCMLGDSAFIGRQPDVGINEACKWYQMPDLTTAIDTLAGLWVQPIVTTTYVVKQEICGNVKWDTVVIYANPTGINEQNFLSENLKIYPVPAQNEILLQFTLLNLEDQFKTFKIYNNLGQKVREEEIVFKNKSAAITTGDLTNGVYHLELKSNSFQKISKRFLISR